MIRHSILRHSSFDPRPLTPALSPEYKGEGVRAHATVNVVPLTAVLFASFDSANALAVSTDAVR